MYQPHQLQTSEVNKLATIYGSVKNIYEEQKTSKAGRPFSVKIAVVEVASGGGEERIELGFANKAPKNISVGGFYQFDTELKYGKHQYRSHSEASAGTVPASASASGGASGGAVPHYSKNAGFLVKTFPVPIDHPDRSIIRQNALGHARAALNDAGYMVTFDAPDGEWKLHPEEYMERVIALAMAFEDFATGDYELRKLKELGEDE